ncbi:MAG TPA: Na+/H+ antiporter NhaA [Acetobacteraceae bacterium]|nr:Na+/H+ antiporter NhaA [Acetobacteraceae bacterium]
MDDTARAQISPPRRFVALLAFTRSQSAGGLALMVTTVIALVWSNSRGADLYFWLLNLPISIGLDGRTLLLPLDGWVNDGLMALFFLTVGLEIRREMTEGQLTGLPRIAAPGFAALGGMIVPALIYLGINWQSPTTLHGWAVPVATDIAFALAAASVLGRRVPIGLKVFLTALAILDDLGAIVVIALFYTSELHPIAMLAGVGVLAALYGIGRAGVSALSPYLIGGAMLWGCLLHAGIHPTLAGVGLAFVVPRADGDDSPAQRLETGLGGWVTWGVLPLFGLANAGLRLVGITPADFATAAMLGIVLGLVIGKQVGVLGATLLATRLRLARLPVGVSWTQLYGGALLCGIGFTMSLFIGDLGFHGTPVHAEVKLATFVGSTISAALGLGVLAMARQSAAHAPTPARKLEHT